MGYAVASGAIENFINSRLDREAVPVPLKSTSYDIEIAAGLAVVKLVRTFRNDEHRPIEATITFPVPFDAVVTRIEARVGDRVLVGKAKAKAVARETYEDAIDRGKTAVLHEELLRGLHMLSVANVAPGVEIEVAATFVVPLSLAAGAAQLRIPVTVGQVYGEMPLLASDALVTGGPVEEAVVTVRSRDGTILVGGQSAVDGRATVKLDRPIELKVIGERSSLSGTLIGRAADGRQVLLGFVPAAAGEAMLDADLLLDVSGSMTSRVSADSSLTQWDAVKNGLAAASSSHLNASDQVNVWVFSDDCRKVGSSSGAGLARLAPELPFDNGGTELPKAVATVVASRRNTNVLLVTDGQSGNTIDVQRAVATGARFTVVLVGEGALETNVGYLAALTGGQMFVAQEADTEKAIVAAMAQMRNVASPARSVDGSVSRVTRRIAGTEIEATWTDAVENSPAREGFAAAVASYAASLAVLGMKEEDAARVAEAEGIVGHLTSLVLVDEVADAVSEVPATRKVALAHAATAHSFAAHAHHVAVSSESLLQDIDECLSYRAFDHALMSINEQSVSRVDPSSRREARSRALYRMASAASFDKPRRQSEWDVDTQALMSGDVCSLDVELQLVLRHVSTLYDVVALADSLGKSPMVVAIALLAKLDENTSRTAARIARSVLKSADNVLLGAALKSALGSLTGSVAAPPRD